MITLVSPYFSINVFFIEVGLTIIISPNWMFVATLTGPYTKHNGLPVYVDPYAYVGIVNIQNTIK